MQKEECFVICLSETLHFFCQVLLNENYTREVFCCSVQILVRIVGNWRDGSGATPPLHPPMCNNMSKLFQHCTI